MKAIIATLVLSCSVSWSALATAETVKLQVAGGEIAAPSSQGRILLNLTLDSSRDLSEFTLRHVGKEIDVLINNNVVVSPHIIDPFLFSGQQLHIPIPAGATGAESLETIEKLVSGKLTLELSSRDYQ
jgi:preprotein translocase subunit SecD